MHEINVGKCEGNYSYFHDITQGDVFTRADLNQRCLDGRVIIFYVGAKMLTRGNAMETN